MEVVWRRARSLVGSAAVFYLFCFSVVLAVCVRERENRQKPAEFSASMHHATRVGSLRPVPKRWNCFGCLSLHTWSPQRTCHTRRGGAGGKDAYITTRSVQTCPLRMDERGIFSWIVHKLRRGPCVLSPIRFSDFPAPPPLSPRLCTALYSRCFWPTMLFACVPSGVGWLP